MLQIGWRNCHTQSWNIREALMPRASLRPGCFAPREECRDALARFLPGAHLRDALGGQLEHLGIGCAAAMQRRDEAHTVAEQVMDRALPVAAGIRRSGSRGP